MCQARAVSGSATAEGCCCATLSGGFGRYVGICLRGGITNPGREKPTYTCRRPQPPIRPRRRQPSHHRKRCSDGRPDHFSNVLLASGARKLLLFAYLSWRSWLASPAGHLEGGSLPRQRRSPRRPRTNERAPGGAKSRTTLCSQPGPQAPSKLRALPGMRNGEDELQLQPPRHSSRRRISSRGAGNRRSGSTRRCVRCRTAAASVARSWHRALLRRTND